MNKKIITLLAVLISGIVSGCESRKPIEINLQERISDDELKQMAQKPDTQAFRFGFDKRLGLQEDARQYLSFLNYLEKATGYKFDLYFTAKDENTAGSLGTGKVQFAAVGPANYILAHEKYGAIPLVRGINSTGKTEYRSLIIVSPKSPVQKIEDLRGKSLAFGDIASTQGHLIPRIDLAEHGMSLKDLAGYKFTGSHKDCANAVISGSSDACGIQDRLGMELAKEGVVRIIHASNLYPSSGIAANKDLSPDVIAKVGKALLDFQPQGRDKAGLYNWNKTEMPNGFQEAQDGDYEHLRKCLKGLRLLDDMEPR